MSMPPPVDPTGIEYEQMPARSGEGGWVLALMHLAIGGVTVALAASEDFARDKAAFSSDAWRVVFGLIGAALVFLAVRAMVRSLNATATALTPATRRRAAVRGRILIAVAAGFIAMGFRILAGSTIALHGWTRPFYVVGGTYLAILGLVFQWDPTRFIRQQRVRKGEGRPGVATIRRASDTGTSVNDAPQVKIEFELEVGGRTYEVSDKVVMERAKLALLIPGATVNVLVDKVDPNVFHIDWESWKAPTA